MIAIMNNSMYLSRFKSYIQSLGLYFLASLIPMVISLVTNPLIAMNMSPEDYAIVGYYGAFNVLFGSFVNFYLIHYYTKRFFEVTDEERIELKATLFKMLVWFSLFLTVVALGLLYLYISIFNSDSQIAFWPYAFLSLFSLPIVGIYNLTLVEYRMQRNAKKFFNLSLSNGLLAVSLSLIFVVVFKWGALGKLGSILLASLIIFCYVVYLNKDIFKVHFNIEIFKTSVKFCFPLVLAAMLTFFSNGYDKVFLEKAGDLVQLGYYTVAVSMAGYISIFTTSINSTFQPDVFQSIVERNFRKCFKYIILKLAIVSVIVVLFILFCPLIIKILTAGRYVDSTPFARILSLSVLTSMLYYSMSEITIALGYTKITLINKIIGSILSVVLFSILITRLGAYGAAWGTVFSFLIFFIGNSILVIARYQKQKSNI